MLGARLTLTTQHKLRATAFLSSFDRFSIPPLLVPIQRDLGVSLGAVAAMASAYFVAYGVSQLGWGLLSERYGRVRVLQGAAAGGIVVCVIAALASSLTLLIIVRSLAGLLFAALGPTAITYLGDTVAPAERQHALALMMTCSAAAIAVSTFLAGALAQWLSWRVVFAVTAILAAGLTVALRGLPEPRREGPRAPLAVQIRSMAGRPWVGIVMAIGFLVGAVFFGALTFVAAALQDGGVSTVLAGSAAAGFGVAIVLFTPLVTRAIPRGRSPLLVGGGAAVGAIGLFVAAVEATVLTGLGASFALGAGFGFLQSTLMMWATQVYPAVRALTVALFSCAIFTGGAAASAAGAPLADAGQFSTIFLSAAIGAVLVAVAGAWLRARWLATHGPAPVVTADLASSAP